MFARYIFEPLRLYVRSVIHFTSFRGRRMADQVLQSGSTQQVSELERRRDGQFRLCMSCAAVVAAALLLWGWVAVFTL